MSAAHSPAPSPQTVGRIQAADRGTLFLDEVGDLPLELQPKLLRVLQEQQVERLGSGGRTTAVDVRVIAATHQDLGAMVQQRTFRADLFYRLNVFPIRLPPLRERAEDIPLLVADMVQRFAKRHGRSIDDIPEDVIATLKRQPWPGNVRELQNVVERAVVATAGRTLSLPAVDTRPASPAKSSWRTLAQIQREHIVATLQATDGVLGGWDGAAARLGLSRTTLDLPHAAPGHLGAGRQPRPRCPVWRAAAPRGSGRLPGRPPPTRSGLATPAGHSGI